MPRKSLVATLALALATLAGCAPDAMNNRQATGFNAFLDQIAKECSPLQIGSYQMSQAIQYNRMDENSIYFMDQTSRLYYGTIAPDSYANSINAFFQGGSDNVAVSCILSKLPQNR